MIQPAFDITKKLPLRMDEDLPVMMKLRTWRLRGLLTATQYELRDGVIMLRNDKLCVCFTHYFSRSD
jgi:hypothetical protein